MQLIETELHHLHLQEINLNLEWFHHQLPLLGPNFILNTIVAETLSEIADRLEKATDVRCRSYKLFLQKLLKNHKRVIFNGNGYSDEWVAEAEKRGLPNIKTTVEATKALIS